MCKQWKVAKSRYFSRSENGELQVRGLSASNCVQQGPVLRWFVGRSGKLVVDANATNILHYH